MAGFKTHITVSTFTGIGYGSAAFLLYDVPLPTCVLASGLCSVAGMLPDLDSDSGVPLRESLAFGASVVPMMLTDRLRHLGLPIETIVLAGAVVYLLVRFGFGALLRKCTVHRGMFHSIPGAIIAGEITFLLASGDLDMRIFKACAVMAGFFSHLLLDEIWSIEWTGYRFRFKKSFGTAFKLWGQGIVSNLVAFTGVGLLTGLIWYDDVLGNVPGQQQSDNVAKTAVEQRLR